MVKMSDSTPWRQNMQIVFMSSSVTEITFSIVVDPTLSRYYVNLLVFTPQNAVDGMEWIAQSWFIMKWKLPTISNTKVQSNTQ